VESLQRHLAGPYLYRGPVRDSEGRIRRRYRRQHRLVLAAGGERAAQVFAYEPFAPCFEWLSRNVTQNRLGGTIRPFNLAVGAHAGARIFHVSSEYTSNSFFEASGDKPVTVQCTTLAAIIDDPCRGWCDFLKLDCEGAEFEILLGASDETLKRVRMMALEVHEGVGGHTRSDLEKRLTDAGFQTETRETSGPLIMRARNRTAKAS
jgi:FkbM family methyltransferase